MNYTDPTNALFLELFEHGFGLVIAGSLVWLAYYLLTLPLNRAERARRFLDVLDATLKQGRPLEETLISISHLGDSSLSVRFHLFAAWLERGLSFDDALVKVPRFLPPQIIAILAAGRKIGDVKKVLPACRQLLRDAVSHTRSAINYLFILAFVITPFGVFVSIMTKVAIIPKVSDLAHGIADTTGQGSRRAFIDAGAGPQVPVAGDTAGIDFLSRHGGGLIAAQIALLLLVWSIAFLYVAGPRLALKIPFLDQIYCWLPWRRKRLQRDFSTMLAILLDSGVPEPEAVALAADSTANSVFRRRAGRVVENLQRGLKLPQALQSMDDSGEFAWRLTNAVHGRTAFLQALAGWHESLDARAFQQEQAVSQGVTTAMVLLAGVYVGLIAISMFTFLVSIVDSSTLW